MRLLLVVFAAAVLFADAHAERSAPQIDPVVTAVRRCSGCGWIESKREVVPQAARLGAPRIFEYTPRMADGSTRIFEEALPTTWRLGERIGVIDGADPALE
jgi:hypothetical protein